MAEHDNIPPYSDDLRRRMRAAGRRAAALRQIVPHVCAVCGKSFEAVKNRRYCSDACRQKHHRQTHSDTPTT